MTKTPGRNRKTETVEDLDGQIAAMEAELAEIPGTALTWDEVTSTAPDELARKEQRRGMLPRLLHAAKVRRLELEERRREEEADSLRERLEPTYAAFQEQEEGLRRAKEERDAAHAEWAITLSAVQSADDRTRQTERELEELREAERGLRGLREMAR